MTKCKGTACTVNDSYNADAEHSVFCQFEHFCAANALDDTRVFDSGGKFVGFLYPRTQIAWKAFTWTMDPQPEWPQ